MICTLSNGQKERFLKKVYVDLKSQRESGKPFSLKDYMRSVYDLVKKSTNNEELAQMYASITPAYVRLATSGNIGRANAKYIAPSYSEIVDAEEDLVDVSNLGKYITFPETLSTLNNEVAYEEQKNIDTSIAASEDKSIQPAVAPGFRAKPTTLNTTTGNSLERTNDHSYEFIKVMLDNDMLDSEKSGYYLGLMANRNLLTPFDTPSERLRKDPYLQVIVDKEGNPIYFSIDGKFTPTDRNNGKLVFFPVRRNEATVQTIAEVAANRGITLEQAQEIREAEKQILETKLQFVTNNPEGVIVQNIIGGSYGYSEEIRGQRSPLSLAQDLSDLSLSFDIIDNKQRKKFSRGPHRFPITFIMNTVASDQNLLNDIANIMFNTAPVKYMTSTGAPVTNTAAVSKLKSDLLKVLFGNNTKLVYNINEDKILYNGKEITTPDELKTVLTTTSSGAQHTFNVKDKNIESLTFYKKEGDTLVVGKSILTEKQYKRFIQDHALTELPINADGTFPEENGYIQFALDPITSIALRKFETVESDIIATDTELPALKTEQKVERKTQSKKFEKKSNLKDDEINDLLNNSKTKNKMRAVKQANPEVTAEQIQKAKEWYESSPLAKIIPFEVMFDIVNSENPRSVATFGVNGIRLYQGSDYTDLYHEAWHGFTDRVLTPNERKSLYTETRNLSGTFKTYEGKTVSFSSATEDELEEWLAEDFRAFMLSDGKRSLPERPKTKSIFQKILDILKIMFNISIEDTMANYNASLFLNEVYTALRTGNINVNNINNDNSTLRTYNKIRPVSAEDTDLTSYEEIKKINDSLESLFSVYVDNYNKQDGTPFGAADLIENANIIKDMYDYAYNQFVDSYEKLTAELEKIDPAKDADLYNRKYSALLTLEWALNNWGSVDNSETGVIAHHMQKSEWFNIDELRLAVQDDVDYTEKLTNDKDGYGHKSGNEVSMKELAQKETLFVIKGLFKYKENSKEYELNDFGLPQLESFDTSWNRIQKFLEGTNSPIEQYEMIQRKAKTDGFFAQLALKLKNPFPVEGVAAPSLTQNALWTDFYNVMSAYRIQLMQLVVDISYVKEEDETTRPVVTVKTGIAQSESSRIGRDWDLMLMNPSNPNPYLKKLKQTATEKEKKNFTNHFDKDSIKQIVEKYSKNNLYLKNPIEFLRALGMNFSDKPEIRAGLENQKTFLNYMMKRLRALATESKNFKLYKIDQIIGNDKLTQSRYKELLKLEQKYSDKYNANMVSNAKNDPQYELSLKSTASVRTKILNEANDFGAVVGNPLTQDLDPTRYPFTSTSLIINRLFDIKDTGKKRAGTIINGAQKKARLELLNSSGVAVTVNNEFQNIGIASSEADATTYTLQNFFSLMQYGVAEGLRHSDKATVLLYRVVSSDPNDKLYFNTKRFGDIIGNVNEDEIDSTTDIIENSEGFTAIVNQLLRYLSSEVTRIHKLREGDPQGNMIVGDTTYKEAASKIVIFEDVLGPELSKEIEDSYVSENFYEVISSKPEFKTKLSDAIADYLRSQIDSFKNDLNETGALDKELLMYNLRKLVENENVPTYKKFTKTQMKDEMLIASYVLNDWIHKYETSILMYGDPALYNHLKEELHKRNAGVAATGIMPRTDAAINTFLTHYQRKYQTSSWYTGNPLDAPRVTTNIYNSAVLQDAPFDSLYYNDYVDSAIAYEEKRVQRDLNRSLTEEEKQEIRSRFSEYQGMKAGDAQGWITLDAYRDLLIRLGKWGKEQEGYYNAILNKEFVDTKSIAQYFPVMKMQYWGNLAITEGLPGVAMHKFSLAPLIPNVIQNTNLEILHNKLVEQGIDYALFQSGSKINTLTSNGKADEFYSDVESKTPAFASSTYKFTVNPIYIDYFKQQLETNDQFKGSSIFPTQLRKLVEEGLMENGVPISWNPKVTDSTERIKLWADLPDLEKIKNPEYKKLLTYESLIKDLTELKKKELIKETELQYDPETNKFTGDTEKLMSFVEKELTRQDLAEHEINLMKYNPATGQEEVDFSIHPSADKIEKLISALIYKRLVRQKANGEPLIQVSGVGYESAAPFRKPTKDELNQYGTNGLPTYRLVTTINPETGEEETKTAAMKVKIALQGNYKKLLYHPDVIELAKSQPGMSKLEALNTLIKREEWLNKDDNRKMVSLVGVRIPVQGLNSMEFAEVYEFLPEIAGNIIIVPAEIVAKSGSDFDIDKLTMLMPSILKTSKGIKLIEHKKESEDINKEALKEELKTLKIQLSEAYKEFSSFSKEKLQSIDPDLKSQTMEFIRQLNTEIKIVENKIMNEFEMGNIYPEELYDELYSLHDEIKEVKEITASPFKSYISENIQPIIDKIDDIKEQLAQGSGKGIENDMLFAMQDILSLESNFVDLVTPNGTYIVKPLADKYADKVRKYNQYDTVSNNGKTYTYIKKKKQEKRISATRVFEIGYNRYKQQSNFIGKKTLGLGAVDNTYNTLFNRIGAYMSPTAELGSGKKKYTVDQRILMPHNTIETTDGKAISLSNIYDKNKKYRISTLISQMMNGWVDVAKDSWIFDIQGNPELSPTLLFLIQAGVPIDTAVAFISQPLIREYVDNQRLIRSTFAKPLGKDAPPTQYRIAAKSEIFKKYFPKDEKLYTSMTQTRTILTDLKNKYLSNVTEDNFTVENLDERIKKGTAINDFDRAVFVHFIELEEMAKATTSVKLGMNVDTSRQSNISDLQEKVNVIESLQGNPRFPNEILNKLETESPIGAFRIQEFSLGILGKLFKLRNHPEFLDFIQDKYKEYRFGDDEYKSSFDFVSNEEFRKTLVSDLAPFMFQYWLSKQNRFESSNSYKSMQIQSEIPKAEAKYFKTGARVVNGVLYVDNSIIDQQYRETKSIVPEMKALGLAPVDAKYFGDANQDKYKGTKEYKRGLSAYTKFVYEREFLRYVIPFEEFSKTSMYKTLFEKKEELFPAKDKKALAQEVYEEFIRNNALFHTMNLKFMMTDEQGYASSIMKIVDMFPDLRNDYSILTSLVPDFRGGIKNLKFQEGILDTDMLNIYHAQLQRLADPSVVKSPNKIENDYISNMFNLFSVFAFYQSGQDLKGFFSMVRSTPTNFYEHLLSRAGKEMLQELNTPEKAMNILDEYFRQFRKQNKKPMEGISTRKRMKTYTALTSPTAAYDDIVYPAGYDEKVTILGTKKISDTLEYLADNPNIIVPYDEALLPKGTAEANDPKAKDKKIYTNTKLFTDAKGEYKDVANQLVPVVTKKTRWVSGADQFLTDDTYVDNVKMIDEFLEELDRRLQSSENEIQKRLVFPENGLGQALIGYKRSQKEEDKDPVVPAPKTFLYLSQKLFEKYGYINPGSREMMAGDIKEAAAKISPVSDDEVREQILKCFYGE